MQARACARSHSRALLCTCTLHTCVRPPNRSCHSYICSRARTHTHTLQVVEEYLNTLGPTASVSTAWRVNETMAVSGEAHAMYRYQFTPSASVCSPMRACACVCVCVCVCVCLLVRGCAASVSTAWRVNETLAVSTGMRHAHLCMHLCVQMHRCIDAPVCIDAYRCIDAVCQLTVHSVSCYLRVTLLTPVRWSPHSDVEDMAIVRGLWPYASYGHSRL